MSGILFFIFASCHPVRAVLVGNPTNSARDEIYMYGIRCGTCNVASDLVESAVAVDGESIPLLHMVLAQYTHRFITSKVTMLDGKNLIFGWTRYNIKQIIREFKKSVNSCPICFYVCRIFSCIFWHLDIAKHFFL